MRRDTTPTVKLYSDRNLRQLKAVRLKFLRNSRGFLSAYRFPIIALAAAAALDCISTMHFMLYERDHMSELHPVFFLGSCVVWAGLRADCRQVGSNCLRVDRNGLCAAVCIAVVMGNDSAVQLRVLA